MIIYTTAAGAVTATILALAVSTPAIGQDDSDPISISGNVSFVTDYRFRGVSLSDEDFALQGGIDLESDIGFYLGTWASTIETINGAETELDIYGGYGREVNGTSYSLGFTLYSFPGGNDLDYIEINSSIGRSISGVDVSAGFDFIPSQSNTGNQDNIFIHGEIAYAIPNTSLALNGQLGYEDGAFGDDKMHWVVGATYDYKVLQFGISYIDTDQVGAGFGSTILFSVGTSF